MNTDLKVGSVVEGTVVGFRQGCVSVLLPGEMLGRLRVAEASWLGGKADGRDLFKLGDVIEVVVKVINSSKNSDAKFFDLGYRELQPNPWETISTLLKIGQKLDGQVIDIVQFGAIIDTGKGVSSLLHNSELSWVDRGIKAAKLFQIGDRVAVVVKTIEPDRMKIGVSFRDGQPNPWDFLESTVPVGAEVTVVVEKNIDFGTFVKLENGFTALLHRSEISESPPPLEGSRMRVRILSADSRTKRISVTVA